MSEKNKEFIVCVPQQWNFYYRVDASSAKEAYEKVMFHSLHRKNFHDKVYVGDIDTNFEDCEVEERKE